MKQLITLLLLLPFIMFAQSPQGVGYQGVATDLNGVELINQAISIQASILSSSATGNIEWQEEHSVTTDTFGLFALTIGQGTSTGNGAQSNFADISWGSATHFLKIEMDVNGGTNYSNMGTNQMMSVPYALYAENTGNSSNIWQQDSLNNISYNLGKVGIGSSNPKENFQIGDRWFFHNGLTKAISYNQFWNGNNWEYETTNPSSGIEFNMGNTGAVSIYTSQSGTAGTQVSGLSQKLTVLNDGKVGIGSSNPKENFQIGDRWFFHNGLTKAISYNQFWNGNNWEYETTNPSSGIEFNMGNTGAVSIYTSQSGTAGTQVSGLSQKLTVLNDGKVGIGTTTPSHTL